MANPDSGELNWRLSAHPATLLCYLAFRFGALLMYLLGTLFIPSFILVFILTLLLLSVDFYYLKNIAGRRLVGLRWWNEVNIQTGQSTWVFESADGLEGTRVQNKTDKRFFWLGLYLVPVLWVVFGILAAVRLLNVIWLVIAGIALILTITNTLAFSRADKFSQASSLAGSALSGSGFARGLAGNMVGRFFK